MGFIRFSDEEIFSTDSKEYEILFNAVLNVKGVPGAIVEIGTRRGGSAKIIIDALTANDDTDRAMFCIDPYGNIEYPETNKAISRFNKKVEFEGDPESTSIVKHIRRDYDNTMRNRVIPSLYYCAYQAGLNFTFFCLEDTEFFKRYSDGVPVYNETKTLQNEYALVFFDGPHTNENVAIEMQFFAQRAPLGAVFVFDDIWMMDHDRVVEEYLFARGWEVLEKGEIKASYVKKTS